MSDAQTNPFGAALIAGKGMLRALKSVPLVYCIDGLEFPVTARVGKTTFVTDTEQQFNTRVRTRDFVVAVTELRHPETLELIEPCEGHRVKETIAGQVHTYEVLPTGDEPGWRDADTTQFEYRIHTKRVAREVAT